jgi:CelD/BcsL family acetyltransferase involved in cellulose biosynthesis
VYRTRLKFVLGEFCLYSAYFRCATLHTHFTALEGNPPSPDRLFPGFPGDVRALLVPAVPTGEELPPLSRAAGAIRYVTSHLPRYYIRLDGTFRDYLQKFTAKQRHNLTRSVAKFREAAGDGVIFREYRAPGEMAEYYSAALRVSRLTYQHRLADSGIPESPDCVASWEAQARTGRIRGYILFAAGRPVAYAHCESEGDCLLYEKVGYDPEFSRFSPGTVLLYLILERLFEKEPGFRIFDFDSGEAQYKRFFSTDSARCASIFYFRPTAANLLLVRSHHALSRISQGLAAIFAALRIKTILKKWLRRT